jgi:hypothetical protein
MKKLSNTALCLALALGVSGAMATTMRCGGTVIDDEQLVPATAAQVRAACGEPTSRESGQWVYQQEGEFTRTLQFDADGNLQSITERPAGD